MHIRLHEMQILIPFEANVHTRDDEMASHFGNSHYSSEFLTQTSFTLSKGGKPSANEWNVFQLNVTPKVLIKRFWIGKSSNIDNLFSISCVSLDYIDSCKKFM